MLKSSNNFYCFWPFEEQPMTTIHFYHLLCRLPAFLQSSIIVKLEVKVALKPSVVCWCPDGKASRSVKLSLNPCARLENKVSFALSLSYFLSSHHPFVMRLSQLMLAKHPSRVSPAANSTKTHATVGLSISWYIQLFTHSHSVLAFILVAKGSHCGEVALKGLQL